MNRKNLTAIVAAIFTFYLVPAAVAEPAICRVSVETSGNFKAATLMCAFKSDPRNFRIRSTIWDSEDPDGYRKRARLAGQSANCEMTETGKTSAGSMETTHYKISDCDR